MFDSSNYHGQDLLFKDATIRAVPVGEKTTYRDWLGPDYVASLEGMLSQQCSGAGKFTPHRGKAGARHIPPASLSAFHPKCLNELRGTLGSYRQSRRGVGVGGSVV